MDGAFCSKNRAQKWIFEAISEMKNDNCYVKQKNYSAVFQPCAKLIYRERVGG